MEKSVLYDLHSHVARIKLNRPGQGNVVNDDNLLLLNNYMDEAVKDKDCRVIVIEGSDGVFSRGMDFKNLLKNTDKKISLEFSKPYIDAVMKIRNSPKPVIAAIDGEVLAGGMGIALSCDIIIATERSLFGLSEVIFGLIPAYVFPFLLERVTLKKARYIVMSSKKFSAGEYFNLGIIDDLAEDEKLERKLTEYIKRLLYSSPSALAITKSYTDKITGLNISDAVKVAGEQLTELLNEKKNIEAIQSFMEGGSVDWMVKYRRKKN